MLKVYNVTHYVSVDGGKWYKVGCGDEAMRDNLESKETIIGNLSFDEWCKLLQNIRLSGIYYSTTFFKKKPCIITHEWSYDSYTRYMHFEKLSYKIVYEERKNVSLAYIMKSFPADQCIQYLKERGITTCPMNF